ncbi:Emc5p NDAI_0A02760 [Naumovozyma dairenensis CBS 421]|uniref:ER membrane protein complex subunit 5 n=1 Tax=Naumovozyma dairenensis (strain ATCC 10597 / BCRC 20456 / CBS 421 / NBRC 0211 / NRRL Y-12639) TaxID=1071378 RepID=G0W3P6_NAUDC|nr:hypothetical protein NDAI_0A02760 [Naumovozyma dairenensis CBS 421]CCD22434.1 hypothetical protein NDAI_0A02760 [Naumovozyma dairenensis CBS 421]
MSIVSKGLLIIAIFQLLHSGFSSYEFHQILKNISSTNDHMNNAAIESLSLPKDIVYEAISASILFALSMFFSLEKPEYLPIRNIDGSEKKLKPLKGDYLKEIALNKSTNTDNLIGAITTGEISYTPSFINIHEKRRIVKQWILENENEVSETKKEK